MLILNNNKTNQVRFLGQRANNTTKVIMVVQSKSNFWALSTKSNKKREDK